MELQVGVKALLKNKDHKFLLLRRNLQKYTKILKSDEWDIPGGRINPGMSLLNNLKREIKEETQLELKEPPRVITAQDILRVPGCHVIRIVYLATIEGEPQLDPDEAVDYKWLSMEEMLEMDTIDQYLRAALKILRCSLENYKSI